MITEHFDIKQNEPEWFAIRAGKPTASAFSKVITGTGKLSSSLESYAAQLAAETVAGGQVDSFEGNQWTERGHELEEMASLSYALRNDCLPAEVGFVTNNEVGSVGGGVGASPDRLIGDDGLLEIKNLSPANHVLALWRYKAKGTVEPKYIPQLQGQLLVTGREWVDLFFHNPDLPALQVRFTRDENYLASLKYYLIDCMALRDEFISVMESIA